MAESSIDTIQQASFRNQTREGIDFVSEYEFHKLFEEAPGASFVIQGYARMLGSETYTGTHTKLTVESLSAFIAAFNKKPGSNIIDDLWLQVREIFGLTTKPEPVAPKK